MRDICGSQERACAQGSVKLGKKRRESSKRNFYRDIVSPKVTTKAIIVNLRARTQEGETMPNFDFSCGRNTFFFGSRQCAALLFSQVPKKCTDLDLSLLYILITGTYGKLTRKHKYVCLIVYLSQR